MTSTSDTKEQMQQTVSTAADEGKHVAAVVGEEAQNVAGEAKDQVRELMDETLGQVNEQSRTQLERLVGTLNGVSTDLESMALSADSGIASQLTQQLADRARGLSTHLDGREPSDVLDDVRRFARLRPGLFLLGALGTGVVVGRLARGAKQAHSHDATSSTTTGTPKVQGIPTLAGDNASDGLTSDRTSAAPSYGQPVIAVPSPPVQPTYPDTRGVGLAPTPPLADGQGEKQDGSGTGPQGLLP